MELPDYFDYDGDFTDLLGMSQDAYETSTAEELQGLVDDARKQYSKMAALLKLTLGMLQHKPEVLNAVMRMLCKAQTDGLDSLAKDDYDLTMNIMCLCGNIGMAAVSMEVMQGMVAKKLSEEA